MKKILFLLFGLILIFITGCSNDKNSSDFHSEIDLHSNTFNGELETFNDQFEDANQYKIDLKIKVDEQEEQVSMNVQLDKMYIEVLENNNRTIITKEGDAYFSYIINDKDVLRTYMGNYSDSQISSEYGLIYTELINSDFDINKLKVSKYGDTYKVEATYGDYLGNKNVDAIKNLYNYYGLSIDSLLESKLTMYFTFLDNGIHFNMLMPIDLTDLDPSLEIINVDYEMKIVCESFEVINIFDGNYNISKPASAYEVYKTSNLYDITSCTDTSFTYYRVYLQKGVFISNLPNEDLVLLDGAKEPMKNIGINNKELEKYPDINNMYVIPNDGNYYLRILTEVEEIELLNYPYSYRSVVDVYSIYDGATLDFTLQGKYDHCRLSRHAASMYKVTNNSKVTVHIFSEDKNNHLILEPNSIGFIPNANCYVFANLDDDQTHNQVKCSLSFEAIETNMVVFDDLLYLDLSKEINVFNKTTYYTYFKQGHYMFEGNQCDISIYDENGLRTSYLSNYSYLDLNIDKYLIIDKEGYYFVNFERVKNNNTIRIRQFEYDTMVDFSSPLELSVDGSIISGTIEGYMDIEAYTIKNDSDYVKLFELVNNSNENLYVYTVPFGYREYLVLEGNQKQLMAIYPGKEIILYVSSNCIFEEGQEPYSYSFSLNEVDANTISNKNSLDKLDTLTTEFSDKPYYIGYGYTSLYIKVEFNNVINFSIASEDNKDLYCSVYDSEGEYVESLNNLHVNKEGTYILSIYLNNSDDYCYSKLKVIIP